MFCAKCGKEIVLPRRKPLAIGARVLEQVDEEGALARLRSIYETYLVRIKFFAVTAWHHVVTSVMQMNNQNGLPILIHDLTDAGVIIVEDNEQV